MRTNPVAPQTLCLRGPIVFQSKPLTSSSVKILRQPHKKSHVTHLVESLAEAEEYTVSILIRIQGSHKTIMEVCQQC